MTRKGRYSQGFTLIELSIVLVIIGLIVGGILVGRDLVSAAATRAQITQIEKYQQAVNTFKGKFGYLPGDIPSPDATNFGFKARGPYAGEGDGNGIIEGIKSNAAGQNDGGRVMDGEAALFWADLSTVNLIDGSFTVADAITLTTFLAASTAIPGYLPAAKLGTSSRGGYPSVYAGSRLGVNYFGVITVATVANGAFSTVNTPLTVAQAYSIDSKIDDGIPLTGNVTAALLSDGGFYYPTTGNNSYTVNASPTYTTATSGNGTTCFDNGGVSGVMLYSMSQSGGLSNCGLIFKFQ